ncbi:DUF6622 family protein [Ralstonia pseudosolanacearum]|uniref:Transmembrane protein n=1 Tax=Ralstonia nicotianae (strain ATCC BAA-1114 / GMI1000) TaxID=267608 RepID=Q8XQR7_RALN1|nr:DUF6622 family protein [Ralstonia pseudosolanacearum]AKZ29061.1 tat pathway signal sequence [Ralstonia solanacearum]AST30123.1 tat pathway signal sequence [Ralstonia pseudosolanacearum]MCF1442329.1 tat pathway signal sequence [Ralstonia solanacearum]MDC6286112.1 tat pathway signal sequence [Ralstonia pseudosolanacearum]MDO3526569.1 tat pathway signal sequence [Ralstonia pseudosolanacearum]
MLASILSHTPTWVRVVFAGLVVLGFRQARPRMVSRRRLIVLPLAVAGSSLYGVALASGYSRLALAAWLLAMAVAFLLMRLAPPRGIPAGAGDSVRVPGSWVPMAVIVGLFVSRYAYRVMLAIHPEVQHAAGFMALFSFVFGLLGGLLLARSILLAARAPRPMAA